MNVARYCLANHSEANQFELYRKKDICSCFKKTWPASALFKWYKLT